MFVFFVVFFCSKLGLRFQELGFSYVLQDIHNNIWFILRLGFIT